jgi:hypothetical protein
MIPELKTITPAVSAKLMTITPAIAAKLLENNSKNRPLSQTLISRLAKEMKEGRWKVNGDMIRLTGFNGKGSVIDGQHRLNAVIKSGVSIQSWIMGGLSEDVFNTIDCGKNRSAADTLFCDGEKRGSKLSAALVIVDQYARYRFGFTHSYTNTEIQELLAKHPDIRNCLVAQKTPVMSPAIFHACIYLFSRRDEALTQSFMDAIVYGSGLNSKDPFYVLRETLLKNRIGTARFTKPCVIALCILAWNFARDRKRISVLRLSTPNGFLEDFPSIK